MSNNSTEMSSDSMDDLISKLDNVDDSIPSWALLIITSVKELLRETVSTNNLIKKIEIMESESVVRQTVVDNLVIENKRLSNEINSLKFKVDDNEQRNRKNCLLIHGIAEGTKENTDAKVIEAINNNVEGVQIDISDLERTHRIGPLKSHRMLLSSQPRCRPIIARFTSFRKRNEIFKKKKVLKGKKISITESLTSVRYKLYQDAITKLGRANVWTNEGRLITKLGDEYITITSDGVLNELVTSQSTS